VYKIKNLQLLRNQYALYINSKRRISIDKPEVR